MGNFTPSSTETFAMAGIPDGLGYVEIDGFNYVFINHELSAAELDEEGDTDTQTATNSTGEQVINGARVSLWQFDQDWNLLGGKNLIEDVVLDGVTYQLNTTTGNYEDSSGNVQWTPIPDDIAVNPDPSVLSDFVDFGPNTVIERDPITGMFPDTNVLVSPDFRSTNF
ncbi:MAG: hypothetical protein QNJ32_03615 [Xenococcaceae cyanobacterium MO_167.B27]|nr:hypothetical protein [Xenococcaceae cyanobacterium MO_167.B27]